MTHPTTPNPWPARVRALRERLDLGREQFARRLNVSQQSVLAWERGWWRPNLDAQRRIEELEAEHG